MKNVRWFNLILALVFLAACGRVGGNTPLPSVNPTIYQPPSPDAAIQAYLDALTALDFPSMYGMLSQANRDAMSLDDFVKRYNDALNAMSAGSVEASPLSSLTETHPNSAQVAFRVIYHSALFGDLQRDFNAALILENGGWHIQWDDGLILPELAGGRHLVVNRAPPARGNIYDRNGTVIVGLRDAYAIGLRSGNVDGETAGALYSRLYQLTGIRPETLRDLYDSYREPNQYIPIGEASAEAVDASNIAAFNGVILDLYTSRFYEPNAGPNITGYVQSIYAEEVDSYARQGYNQDEMIGRTGVEKWAEQYLHGRDGASLYVATADGTLDSVVAQAETQPADSIYLTIDSDLQQQAQAAMDGLPGAIVVMEVSTGRILAMVSSPGFDPNWYNPDNYNQPRMDPPETFNRATQGQYPLGSVFKIITMAAALESGDFTVASTWDCTYDYTELVPLGGPTLYDWTWERCLQEMEANGTDTCTGVFAQPSGMLTLPQGLMRSCDPWFYHIGFTLFQNGKGALISDMARGFGLGTATGIGQVAESDGFIPAAATDGTDATSIAIGQGQVQVTPLQAAAFIAAVANGGTLYRPQLVESIQPVNGDPLSTFVAQIAGTLPVSPEHLRAIQDAMRLVVQNPRGTAYSRLGTFSIPVAAKTGTAESGAADPHAWFAGYSLAGRPDKPDIAVVVVVNNQGEGSQWAAPIFRRIMEIYFFGQPSAIYPFELGYGVVNPNAFEPVPTATPGP